MLRCDPARPSRGVNNGSVPAGTRDISIAVDRLRGGGLVAFPTETVYGLGADALNESAVRRVFELKGRPANNPLIVHVADAAAAREVVAYWPREAQRLAEAFWPGPLSIVLPKAPHVSGAVTGDGPTVAVRCPDHPLTLALLRAFDGPLVGPSANLSGRISPTSASHVRESFGADDVFVLDGGECRVGIESTVVSLADDEARILRPGVIGPEQIARIIGRGVAYDEAPPAEGPLSSPGLLASHYAPAARAMLVDSEALSRLWREADGQVVALAISPIVAPPPHRVIPMPETPEDYARVMYTALRMADRPRTAVIAVETPPADGTDEDRAIWRAVLDRLTRATATRS
ncbi:Threonylcarbamoyl-AMP synthase [Phycisphaerales bacterium]|nr:Threonylcarbamoyl-AMP synthase [Phycisphaerales bacterium]